MSGIFDEYYREYDLWYERNKLAYLSELEAVKIALPEEGRGLEVGVGTGRFASRLGIPYGIDPSFRMAKFAEDRGVRVIVARGEEMPFKDDEFDYALIAITLCFVRDPERVIRETRRVLRDGGRIIVAIIDRDSFLGRAYQVKKSKFYEEARFFSVDEVVNLLGESGFDDFSLLQTIFRFPHELEEVERVEVGYGRGGFVVISARKIGR
ncbi:TPA: class I SAM-dependent methyltransferase [Candidatus Poribacteria bacterium]|nr:class I SAM-dependent methyltransferase [Candidatus Poribacteria bacterium]HEX30189.1 class I SAM-dependent methyltransferase [Candidatus Poribacteria bacterium]